MGYLSFPKSNGSKAYTGTQNTFKYRKSNYSNKSAVENVIRDVTRTRSDEHAIHELISYGGIGVDYMGPVENMIQQINYIQYINNNKPGTPKLIHEVYRLSYDDIKSLGYDFQRMWYYAYECASTYFNMGFMVVFAIHNQYNPNHSEHSSPIHFHFVISTVNHETGNKWNEILSSQRIRNDLFNSILESYRVPVPENLIQPIIFRPEDPICSVSKPDHLL